MPPATGVAGRRESLAAATSAARRVGARGRGAAGYDMDEDWGAPTLTICHARVEGIKGRKQTLAGGFRPHWGGDHQGPLCSNHDSFDH